MKGVCPMLKKLWIFVVVLILLLAGCKYLTPDPIPANPYAAEDFEVANGFLNYRGDAPSYVGVDVSSYQGEIDWQKAADAGVQFAVIRAGYRGYTEGALHEDECYRQNVEGALAAGLEVGVYFFSQAVNEAEALEEAEFLLELIQDDEITYPVVFDWEKQNEETSRTRETGGDVMTACTVAFCRAVEEAGYLPMVYFSPFKGYTELDLKQLLDWPFWLAHYTDDWEPTSFRYDFAMWQYTSNGQVDGITGRVDLDLCLTDFSEWNAPEEEE